MAEQHDPTQRYEYRHSVTMAQIAASGGTALIDARIKVREELAKYPGVLFWEEFETSPLAKLPGVPFSPELAGIPREVSIVGTKYPPEFAERLIARRQERINNGKDPGPLVPDIAYLDLSRQ